MIYIQSLFVFSLLRLRKALVLAESKKFSGTPAFLKSIKYQEIDYANNVLLNISVIQGPAELGHKQG